MKRITRNIELAEAHDLLARVPRACLAFGGKEGPDVEPVTVLFEDERYLVGMRHDASSHPVAGEEVVLLIDEGYFFFDLRAVYIRGEAVSADAPNGGEHLRWLRVEPAKQVAWDYGRMREVEDES